MKNEVGSLKNMTDRPIGI